MRPIKCPKLLELFQPVSWRRPLATLRGAGLDWVKAASASRRSRSGLPETIAVAVRLVCLCGSRPVLNVATSVLSLFDPARQRSWRSRACSTAPRSAGSSGRDAYRSSRRCHWPARLRPRRCRRSSLPPGEVDRRRASWSPVSAPAPRLANFGNRRGNQRRNLLGCCPSAARACAPGGDDREALLPCRRSSSPPRSTPAGYRRRCRRSPG